MDYTIFTPNPSAGGSIRRLMRSKGLKPRYVIDCQDELSVGPLLPLSDMKALATARCQFWRQHGLPVLASHWLSTAKHYRSALSVRPIELWVGTTVQEQITLLAFLALAREAKVKLENISLVQFPYLKGRESLGGYDVEPMSKHPAPEVLTAERLALYMLAWDALCQPTPIALFELAKTKTGLPALDAAISAFILRYPQAQNGLGSMDIRLLEALGKTQQSSAYVIAEAMALLGPPLDRIGDLVLFDRLIAMGHPSLNQPLVEIFGTGKEMRHTEVKITAFGKACLAGEANMVEVNEIEDQIAGLRLSSKLGKVWFHDEGASP